MTLDIVMTDTFGDAPNYSWVVRKTVKHTGKASDTAIVRKVKRTLGITYPHKYYGWNNDTFTIEFRAGFNIIIFVTEFSEPEIIG
jgi:hypothetical protein